MRVLHLSTTDEGAGAARAAFRLHNGLRRQGVDSQMLVLKKTSAEPSVVKLKYGTDIRSRVFHRRRRRSIERDFAKHKSTLPTWFEWFSDDRSEVGYDLVRQLPEFDILNLHWVGGLIDHQLLFPRIKAKRIVWRLADMGALTGGCHYDNGCGKFAARCGACPVLGSTIEDDLSRQVWTRKKAALSVLPDDRMHLIATSRWIAAESRKSSLLGRFPVTIIPNGLDVADFAPRDVRFSREMFGAPQDKKIILFIADTSRIKRKGFDQLMAALAGLNGRDDLMLMSVGGHKPDVPLPLLHLGRINNDKLLSMVYSAADVFVIPSQQESFGQTVTESMACGTPVVGFDTGGIPDMVRPGVTGYLAPLGDDDGLRDGILKVIDDLAGRSAMSARCRKVAVDEYSVDRQARAYHDFYRTLFVS